MKISISKDFLEWFEKTNPHLYEEDIGAKELSKEVTDYVNDVLGEHIEILEAELSYNDDDDAPDSGFVEGGDKLF